MFKINRRIEYALIALKYMSQKEKGALTSAKEISNNHLIPFDPTSRVLQIMHQRGILQGHQGIQGGYQIIKDLSTISLKDLSEMIDGPIRLTKCMRRNDVIKCHKTTSCKILAPMLTLNKKFDNFFESIMLTDLIEAKIS